MAKSCKAKIAELKEENECLKYNIAVMEQTIKQQFINAKEMVDKLEAENAELKARLDKTCENAKDLNITTFTFGEALRRLKQGQKVARKGWNGKRQYIELATSISYVNTRSEIINVEHNDIGNKAIAFVGTSGVQMGWLASQADMLAEDWVVHEDN